MANEQTRPPAAQGESSGESSNAPTYSEKQVTEILHRAAQLERGRAQQTPGLSLADIENIAREAGLDPSLVRIAAQSFETREGERGLKAKIFGAPTHRVIERVVDGEISAADHERLIGDLRGVVRSRQRMHPPQISSVGRTLTMSSGFIELEMAPRDGKTVVRIEVNCGPIAGGFYGGLLGGVGGGLTPMFVALSQQGHLGPAGVVLGIAGLWAGTFTLARTLFSWRANAEFKKMEKLADRLAERLREEFAARAQK